MGEPCIEELEIYGPETEANLALAGKAAYFQAMNGDFNELQRMRSALAVTTPTTSRALTSQARWMPTVSRPRAARSPANGFSIAG